MKKLNSIVYQKLLLQAEEAKEVGLTKLASAILSSLGPISEDEKNNYNFDQLKEDVYSNLWKTATYIMKYHDVESVDAEKIHNALEVFAIQIIEEIEQSLGVENTQIGPLETKVPGEIE